MARVLVGYVFLALPVLTAWSAMVDPENRGPRRVTMALNLLIVFLALLTALRTRFRKSAIRTPVGRAAALFFTYLVAVTVLLGETIKGVGSVDQLAGLVALLIWLLPAVAVMLVPPQARDLPTVKRLLATSVLLVSASIYVSAGAMALGYSFGESLEYGGGLRRYFGPLGDQVSYVVLLGVFLALARRSWIACGIHVVALLLTGTRGALITLVVGVAVYLFMTFLWRGGLRRVQSYVSAIVLLGVLGTAFTTSIGRGSLARFFDPDMLENGVSTRTASIQLGLEAAQQHPVFGVGFNGFTRVAYELRGEALFRRFIAVYVSNASNQYVQTMVEGGIIGLVLFAYLLVQVLRDAWQARLRAAEGYRPLFEGLFLWLSAMMLGDHASVWLLPGFLPCVYVFTLGAIVAARVAIREMPAERAGAPEPALALARYAG